MHKIGFITERQLESGQLPPAFGTNLAQDRLSVKPLFVPNIMHLSDTAFAAPQHWRGRVVFVGEGLLLTHNEYGQPAWDVEWRTAQTPQGLVVNLCNYRHEPVTVRVFDPNLAISLTDILTGRKLGHQLTLQSLQPALARVTPEN